MALMFSHRRSRVKTQVLPNCLIVGPQRAGTTWQHRYLASHPDVEVARGIKETRFFDVHHSKGLDWYASHFGNEAGVARVVEVAPTYFHDEAAPERIRDDLGVVPIICTLRHPARRAFSLYLMLLRYGITSDSFREAVRAAPYLSGSVKYGTHVARWQDVMGAENVHVMFLEDLVDNQTRYGEQLCELLDVPVWEVAPELRESPNRIDSMPYSGNLARMGTQLGNWARSLRLYWLVNFGKSIGIDRLCFGSPGVSELPTLSDDDHAWFSDHIAEEIEVLERRIDLDLSHWRTESLRAGRHFDGHPSLSIDQPHGESR